MSRNAKIALVVVGVLVVLCVGICGVSYFAIQRFGSQLGNPDNARQVGAEIADYTLPPGYHEQGGMNLLIYKMVFIAPEERGFSNGMVIMLMSTAAGAANQEQMKRQMETSFQQQFNRSGGNMRVVGTEHVMIRGQDTVLTIAENEGSPPIRQVIGTFQGKSGLVILMVMGNGDNWDDTAFKNFVASIQ